MHNEDNKVFVATIVDATFATSFSWWSNWIDVAIVNYGGTFFLIQMRISRLNKKTFAAREIPFANTLFDLSQCPSINY